MFVKLVIMKQDQKEKKEKRIIIKINGLRILGMQESQNYINCYNAAITKFQICVFVHRKIKLVSLIAFIAFSHLDDFMMTLLR